MKDLRFFETEEQYENYKGGGNVTYPHVCYTEDTDKVFVHKTEPSNIITFYIDGNEHIALKGMTWSEWCNISDEGYNDGSDTFEIDGECYQVGCDHYWSTFYGVVSSAFNLCTGWCVGYGKAYIDNTIGSDTIIPNHNYSVRLEFNGGIE